MSIELDALAGVTEPDERHRFNLRKFIFRGPVKHWRVYSENGGRIITLEAVEQ